GYLAQCRFLKAAIFYRNNNRVIARDSSYNLRQAGGTDPYGNRGSEARSAPRNYEVIASGIEPDGAKISVDFPFRKRIVPADLNYSQFIQIARNTGLCDLVSFSPQMQRQVALACDLSRAYDRQQFILALSLLHNSKPYMQYSAYYSASTHNIHTNMQIINNLWPLLSKLKDCEFYAKELFRVLAEIVQEFRAFACKLINVRGGLINAVIKGFISNETAN